MKRILKYIEETIQDKEDIMFYSIMFSGALFVGTMFSMAYQYYTAV